MDVKENKISKSSLENRFPSPTRYKPYRSVCAETHYVADLMHPGKFHALFTTSYCTFGI